MLNKSKKTMVVTVLLLGSFLITGIATGNATSSVTQIGGVDLGNMSDEELANMPEELSKGLGQVFRMFKGLGPSGAALGEVFGIILGDFMNIEVQDTLIPHVYMLNASYSDSRTWGENFSSREETHYLWRKDYLGMIANNIPYVEITKTGNVTYEYEYGASAVIIIWDNDDSFINAIQKVINAFKAVMGYMEEAGDANSWTEAERNEVIALIIGEVLEAVTYLLIHINDMINGDELIVTNIITWNSKSVTYSEDFAITKTIKIDDGDDQTVNTVVPQITVDTWIAAAEANNNDYVVDILSPIPDLNGTSREWSHFTFNLIEIWLKNFEIHINVAEIINALIAQSEGMGGGGLAGMPIYEIFQGLDIEIYLMTHSLKGFITYNDSDGNNVPSVEYTNVGTETDTEVISDSEAEHFFVLGDLGTVIWNEPALTTDGSGISWSLRMENPEMAAIPIGLGPQEVSNIIPENLEFIEMGFTFTPKLKETINAEGYSSLTPEYETVQMAKGLVKLDQYFGTWNAGGGPNNPDLAGLDFSVIFISTITHFHVHFEVEELGESPETAELYAQAGLLEDGRYVATEENKHGQIKVGRFNSTLPVAAVDIAGPEYWQAIPSNTYNASTTTLPLAFFAFDAQAEVTYVDSNDPNQSFEAGGFLELESSVLIYAVNYPSWDGSGDMIWHDPTFSVFMTWDNPGFWAVILVIGGVTLVAVAAIMITRRKNRI